MNTIPVITSTLSAQHLNVYLRELYHLSSLSTCTLLRAGVNHSYLVEDGATRYVFRIYSLGWRTREEIVEELRLIRHLHSHAIQASYPIADIQGNDIQTLEAPEGTRYAVMFSYAPGNKLQNFSETIHEQIGVMMGRIHNLTIDYALDRTTYSSRVLLIEPLETLKRFLPAQTEEMMFMFAAQQELLQAFKAIDTLQLRKGAVHLDIWFDNLNISKEHGITLFDFDFCGNGWLCLDIAYYLMQLSLVEPDEAQYILKRESFLKGYESIAAISAEEKRILPMLSVCLYFFYLGVQCKRFDNWSNVFLNEAYLKRYIIARVKRMYDIAFADR
ncbi:phosphotransferase enzyme family protein [Ohtaekwangia sp.]|uniref:phosphotransferase enzyme family protein n=1 Tax=Ohtaekwangia sp. TaxID=2066019 RepID=UPI002F94CD19